MPNGPDKTRWRQRGDVWESPPYMIERSADHNLYLCSVLHPGNYIQLLGTSHNLASAKLKCRLHAKEAQRHGNR
jgi:hypothetical protein